MMTVRSQDVPKKIELYIAEDAPRPRMTYSPCIRAGNWLFTAGQLATDFEAEDGVAPQAVPQNPNAQERLVLETNYILNNLKKTIAAAGADMATDTVRMWDWYVLPRPTMEEFAADATFVETSIASCLEVQSEYLSRAAPPATVRFGIRELLIGNTNREIDILAFHPDDGDTSVSIAEPPELSPGAYARPAGIRRGDWLFLSGQVALEQGADGRLEWAPGCDPRLTTWLDAPVEAQAERALDRLEAILESAGSSLANVVKADVYIGHPRHFAAIERVWRRRFPNDPPAKTVVPFAGMGARGQLVEIALTALASGSELPRQAIETSDAPEPLGHEPQAMRAGQYLFYSQQMAFDSSGALAEGMQRGPGYPYYGQPAKQQFAYMMENVARIGAAAGSSNDNLCKRQCFHDHYAGFAETWAEWRSNFIEPEPCSTTLRLGGPLVVEGAHVLLDLIGYIP